jgi:hypothetical protein
MTVLLSNKSKKGWEVNFQTLFLTISVFASYKQLSPHCMVKTSKLLEIQLRRFQSFFNASGSLVDALDVFH